MSKFGQMVVLTSGARGAHHYPHLIHILWHKAVLVRWSRYCCVKMFQVERKDGVEVRMILAAIVVWWRRRCTLRWGHHMLARILHWCTGTPCHPVHCAAG